MIFVTADTHFDHTNIIRYCDRPYDTAEEMTTDLIRRWNQKVTDNDLIIHLGDVTMRSSSKRIHEILEQLNGRKVLIKGNHDHRNVLSSSVWDHVDDQLDFFHEGTYFFMCHYPLDVWDLKEQHCVHLHGHAHGRSPECPNRYDVGVDVYDYSPVELDYFVIKE